jgi:hypothetical protein
MSFHGAALDAVGVGLVAAGAAPDGSGRGVDGYLA